MEGESNVQELIYRLRNGSARQRWNAIVDLEEQGAQEAVPALLEFLDFPDAGVRANIAHALGVLGDINDKRVGTALVTLLDDPDPLVRINAAESSGILRISESIHALVNVLYTDKDALVRLHAAEALGIIHDPAALPALIEALDDRDEGVRAYSAAAIGDLAAVEALPILKQKLASERSTFTRAFLLSSLYRLGDENALFSLIKLSETADDTLATTILNLTIELATPQNVASIKEGIKMSTQSRPALKLEAASLIERLDRIHDES